MKKNSGWLTTVHYGWFIVAAGLLCNFGSIGIGRFALGMLLPAMATGLDLSYAQMGYISTFNFVGYLVSVLACGPLVKRFGFRNLIFFALILVGVTMGLVFFVKDFLTVLVLYTLTGVGTGMSNVPIMALVPAWFKSSLRGRAAGFIVVGSGFAILLSGWLIPFVNSLVLTDGWRVSWLVLGVIVFFIAFICRLVLRDSPEEVGLTALGSEKNERERVRAVQEDGPEPLGKAEILHVGALYYLFGFSYVIYATFLVTSLVQERGFSEVYAGQLWSLVGLLSLVSGPVFGAFSDRFGRKAGLMTVFGLQTVAYLLVALNLTETSLYLSIFCYGIVAWSIPSIMTALIGDRVGPDETARIFGIITFIFAIGQITGPAMAGHLAETSGSFSGSFLVAAACTAAGFIGAFFLRKERR